jgi:hypothetical protein
MFFSSSLEDGSTASLLLTVFGERGLDSVEISPFFAVARSRDGAKALHPPAAKTISPDREGRQGQV